MIEDKGTVKVGSIFETEQHLVVVYDGSRGPEGKIGPDGDTGDQGDSIVTRGDWVLGTTYCPLDAVSWRSSLLDHVNSLYVQMSSVPCQPSNIPPNEDLGRWTEIGAVDWDNAFGGIWTVQQTNHGFTMVGQPVAYSFQSDSYVLADPSQADEIAICVVREVVSTDRVILQTSGEVPNIDAAVIYPDGSDWEPGKLYYVSSIRGRLSLTPPTDSQSYVNAILKATDVYAPGGGLPSGGRNGVALPYTPTGGPGTQDYVTVGWNKFYFTMTDVATVEGEDEYGNVLEYQIGPNTDVFQNGVNLRPDQFTASNGSLVRILAGAWAPGDRLEIWTPDRPLNALVQSTVLKLDNISDQFDDTTTTFELTAEGTPFNTSSTPNVQIWLDATAQEPLLDYTIQDLPGSQPEDTAHVVFFAPPEAGARFWGHLYAPVDSVPPGIQSTASVFPHSQTTVYAVDDFCSVSGVIYFATAANGPGAFNINDWKSVSAATGTGVTFSYEYTTSTAGQPGDGSFGFTGAPANATNTIRVSINNMFGLQVGAFFENIRAGDFIYMVEDTGGAESWLGVATGPAALVAGSPSWVEIPCSMVAVDGVSEDNRDLKISIITNPASKLPPGGTTGQVLTKLSDDDYDVAWVTPT